MTKFQYATAYLRLGRYAFELHMHTFFLKFLLGNLSLNTDSSFWMTDSSKKLIFYKSKVTKYAKVKVNGYTVKNIRRFYGKITGNQLPVRFTVIFYRRP